VAVAAVAACHLPARPARKPWRRHHRRRQRGHPVAHRRAAVRRIQHQRPQDQLREGQEPQDQEPQDQRSRNHWRRRRRPETHSPRRRGGPGSARHPKTAHRWRWRPLPRCSRRRWSAKATAVPSRRLAASCRPCPRRCRHSARRAALAARQVPGCCWAGCCWRRGQWWAGCCRRGYPRRLGRSRAKHCSTGRGWRAACCPGRNGKVATPQAAASPWTDCSVGLAT
jgi:hypothetical protein